MANVRAYLRVSLDEQVEGFSLDAQLERIEAFCKSQGWTIVACYREEGESAKDTNRPRFQQLLREAQRGDVIVVYRLDRMTRSVRDLDDLMKEFEKRDLRFASVTERFDTTSANGRLFLYLVALFAQWERETIAERSSMGKRQRVLSGEWSGGPIPFGYTTVPTDRVRKGKIAYRLEPDATRAHLVMQMFEKYVSGWGVRTIVKWLNDDLGVRTAAGVRFSKRTVMGVLRNPIYCGDVIHGRRTKGPVTRVQGNHTPLVSRELFEHAQNIMASRKLLAPRQATGVYPLAGVSRCGVCGASISGFLKRGSRSNYPAYRCMAYHDGHGCGSDTSGPLSTVNAARVEASLLEQMSGLVDSPAHLEEFFAKLRREASQRVDVTDGEIDRLRADIAECEAAIEQWTIPYEKKRMEWEEYDRRTSPHKERLKTLRERLEEIEKATPVMPDRTSLEVAVIGIKQAWESLEAHERKQMLVDFVQAFPVQIRVYPDHTVRLAPSLPS